MRGQDLENINDLRYVRVTNINLNTLSSFVTFRLETYHFLANYAKITYLGNESFYYF